MKIGFYSPYLDTIGGGERYFLTLVSCLARKHQVEIFWDDESLKDKLVRRLGINLDEVFFGPNLFSPRASFLSRIKKTRPYDLIFYLSDGSIPVSLAKKNILHFQVPFTRVKGKTFLNKVKFNRFQSVVCNSYFTKKFIDQTYGVRSVVVYPPAALNDFKPLKKENLILSVGRFTSHLHAKKQEILIKVFKAMVDQGLKDWRLVLAGGVLEGDDDYFKQIRKAGKGYPIEVLKNIPFSRLKELYGRAKVYWLATGFGEDEKLHPERMEHFGISVIEAMAAGCAPIVYQGGGLTEIIKKGVNGYWWSQEKELIEKTRELIKDDKKRQKIVDQARVRSLDFSREIFCRKFDEIIDQV